MIYLVLNFIIVVYILIIQILLIMNITNIKNEIKNFLGNMNINVIDISYVQGNVVENRDPLTGDIYEEKMNDTMNVILSSELNLNEEQDKKLTDFETYLYFSYSGLELEYNINQQ